MNRAFLDTAFRRLAQKLDDADIHCEVCVYGGAALVYAYRLRGMSMDVDYRIISMNSNKVPQDVLSQTVRKLIRSVGEELGLAPDWMNDGVKGFTASDEEYAEGVSFGKHVVPALKIVFPSPEYLLAMKCIAMRDESESPHDRRDILDLARAIGIADADEVLDIVQKFYPPSRLSAKVEFGVRELMDASDREENREVEDEDLPGI